MEHKPHISPTVQGASETDLDDIMKLVDQEQWAGYHIDDLKLAFRVSPENCFVIRHERVVASCFSLVSNGVGYISYLLVDKAYRLGKYGLKLGTHCLRETIGKSETVIIYANQKLTEHYARYGFKRLYEVKRFELSVDEDPTEIPTPLLTWGDENYHQTEFLLNHVYSNSRKPIFSALFEMENYSFYGSMDEDGKVNSIIGLFSLDDETLRIGPLVTYDRDSSRVLLKSVLINNKHKRILCEAGAEEFMAYLKDSAISANETGVAVEKMYFGNSKLLENTSSVIIEGGHHFC